MYAIAAPQSLSRRFARHLLAVLGLAALLLAAGLDSAEAAIGIGGLDDASVAVTTWLALGALALALFVAGRRTVPARMRRRRVARLPRR